jgi:hypothetical protein
MRTRHAMPCLSKCLDACSKGSGVVERRVEADAALQACTAMQASQPRTWHDMCCCEDHYTSREHLTGVESLMQHEYVEPYTAELLAHDTRSTRKPWPSDEWIEMPDRV